MIKDSGARQQFASGMQRDVTTGKIDYTFILKGPMLDRWAKQLMDGAKKYDRDNWMKASGEPELLRFRESAMRHLVQWLRGDTDEDHAAAVFFNINGAEYVRSVLAEKPAAPVEAVVRVCRMQGCGEPATHGCRGFEYCDRHATGCDVCHPLRDL